MSEIDSISDDDLLMSVDELVNHVNTTYGLDVELEGVDVCKVMSEVPADDTDLPIEKLVGDPNVPARDVPDDDNTNLLIENDDTPLLVDIPNVSEVLDDNNDLPIENDDAPLLADVPNVSDVPTDDNTDLPIDVADVTKPEAVPGTHAPAPGSGNDTPSSSLGTEGKTLRKRKSSVECDRKSWSKEENKRKRVMGESFIGYRREDKTSTKRMIQDVQREAKILGPRCEGGVCEKWSTRECKKVTESQRAEIHNYFWKTLSSWGEKKQYLRGLINMKDTKQKTTTKETSRRGKSIVYHLKAGNERFVVCKTLFESTLSLKWSTIRRWIGLAECYGNEKPEEDDPSVPQATLPSPIEAMKKMLNAFLDDLPKLESHYCRQSTSRVYVQNDITSFAMFYRLYKEYSAERNIGALSRFSFDRECKRRKISIFQPRKDQCDTCYQYKAKNLSESAFQKHVQRKNEARHQKEVDKLAAGCYTICCDLQAVQLVPKLQASACYFKMKLALHNFTVYDLESHDAKCYYFDESQTDLVASTFATCLVDYIENLITSKGLRPIVNVYSDGCTYQNRNAIMSNALLDLSMKRGITINQKYLEKGHTQMECDSVHSVLESAMQNRDINLPSQFVDIARNARRNPFPYRVQYCHYNFFKDYSKNPIYPSIRPGKKPGDPVVTDLRWLQYNPNGTIYYALDFSTELQPLPLRPKKIDTERVFPQLNEGRRKIPRDKWKDLQDMKPLLPSDCQYFYELLPHEDNSVREQKRKAKAGTKK